LAEPSGEIPVISEFLISPFISKIQIFKEITVMKNTYLVYKDVNAEKKELVVATPQEWHNIMEENKRLPREQRRFFIKECISDSENID